MNKELDNNHLMLNNIENQYKSIISAQLHTPLLSQQTNIKIQKLIRELRQTENQLNSKLLITTGKNNSDTINVLLTRCSDLQKKVSSFKAALPVAFQSKETRSFFQRVKQGTWDAWLNFLNSPTRKYIYAGYTEQKDNNKLLAHFKQLENQLLPYSEKKQNLCAKLEELTNKLSNPDLKPKEESKINKEISKCTEEIKKISKKAKPLEEAFEQLKIKVEKIRALEIKGDEMRQACQTLGGNRVTLTTADHIKLDGMYLDAQAFRKKLTNAGCEHIKFTASDDLNQPISIDTIAMSQENYEKSGKEIIKALKILHAFSDPSLEKNASINAGWQVVYSENKVLLVPSSSLPENKFEEIEHPLFKFDDKENKWTTKEEFQTCRSSKPMAIDTQNPASGTVILSLGNSGVYEQNRTETAFYLLRNMNVMLFNFRGFGASEGVPTQEGLKLDMESAYQYAKMKSGHRDNHILFKSSCLSGSIAAYVASKHSKTNIIVDRTFSSFKQIMIDRVGQELRRNSSETEKNKRPNIARAIMTKIICLAASIFIPAAETASFLAKINGKKAILYTLNDEALGINHVEDNIKAILKAGKGNDLTVIEAPGSHDTSPLNVSYKPNANKEKDLLNEMTIVEKQIACLKTEIPTLESELKVEIQERIIETTQYLEAQKEVLNQAELKLKGIEKKWIAAKTEKKIHTQYAVEHFLYKSGIAKSLFNNAA